MKPEGHPRTLNGRGLTRAIALAFTVVLGLGSPRTFAQTDPASGVYQIVSGRYAECCGLVGIETSDPLPSPRQAYIQLTVDASGGQATLAFLAGDMRTVFETVHCPPSHSNRFLFQNGAVLPDGIRFQNWPGPLPSSTFWDYTVTNAGTSLHIDGVLRITGSLCSDAPTRFRHTNVVAVLMSGPILKAPEFTAGHAPKILVQGHAGRTVVIEGSTNLAAWAPLATNIMDYSLCPICPYVLFEDKQATNFSEQFYRAFELP